MSSYTFQLWQWKSRALQMMVLLFILQVLIVSLTNYSGLSFDEAIWQYIGSNWLRHGLVPYNGGVDNKSPLIYIIYGCSDLLFGVNAWFPRLLAIVCQSIGIFFVYRIANHIAGKQAGILAMLFYGLSLTWRSTDGKMVSLTQTYETTFLLISFYYYFLAQNKSQFFFSGLMAGLALGFRLTAALPLLVIPLALVHKKMFSQALVLLSGVFASSCLLLGIFYFLNVDMHSLLQYCFSDNFNTGSVTDHPLAWKLEQFSNAFFYSEMILFYPFLFIYLQIKRKSGFLLFWLIAVFAGISVIGMFARTHLKELLPPLSIISAVSLNYLLNNYSIAFRPALLVLVFAFFPKSFEPVFAFRKLFQSKQAPAPADCKPPYRQDEALKQELGLWIKANTSINEKVFVAGYGAEVQAYSERLSPTIYFNVTQTPAAKKRLYSDLTTNPPAMIAVPLFEEAVQVDIQQFIAAYISKGYYQQTCLYGYEIYRAKSVKEERRGSSVHLFGQLSFFSFKLLAPPFLFYPLDQTSFSLLSS